MAMLEKTKSGGPGAHVDDDLVTHNFILLGRNDVKMVGGDSLSEMLLWQGRTKN